MRLCLIERDVQDVQDEDVLHHPGLLRHPQHLPHGRAAVAFLRPALQRPGPVLRRRNMRQRERPVRLLKLCSCAIDPGALDTWALNPSALNPSAVDSGAVRQSASLVQLRCERVPDRRGL